MTREKRKKKRKARPKEQTPRRQVSRSDLSRDHAQARYGSLKGRSVSLEYEIYGPKVKAQNPQELEERATRILIDAMDDTEN